jgi:hypothetical protein
VNGPLLHSFQVTPDAPSSHMRTIVIVGFRLLVRRSGAAFVGAALLKKEVAQSRQRVRHKLRPLLLRYPQDDVDEALRDQGCKVGSVGTAGGIRSSTISRIAQRRHSSASRLQVESAVYPPAWLSFQQVVLT